MNNAEHRQAVGVVLGLILFFAAWHAPGLFGGRAYAAEDTLAYFASNRAVHYDLARGGELSWWDPLPGLGQPRLANIQNGSLSPPSVLFYALPVQTVFRFYPFLLMSGLGLASFALFRSTGVGPLAAAFGALSWCTLANLTTHFQHPPAIETLLWLPVALWAWERFVATDRARYALVSGLSIAFQAFGASPQYLLYNALVMALWIGEALWRSRRDAPELWRRASTAAGIAILGVGLASWQLLPFFEFAQHGHRELLSDPGLFRDQFRSSPTEVLRSLGAEIYWWIEAPVLAYGAPYRNLPNASFVTVAFALSALAIVRALRPRVLAAGALFFLLGTLGSAGGATTLLGWVVPFADRLRAPLRMIVPAGFLLASLAALGAQRLPLRSARMHALVLVAATLWIGLVGWTLVRPLDHYVDPAVYDVPAIIAEAPGRIAVDALNGRGTPLFATNAGLAAGVPVLLQREVLIPANFFAGYFASQFGSLAQTERLDRLIVAAALPLVDANAPLLRSYGLRSVIRYEHGRPRVIAVADPVDRFRWIGDVRSEATSEALWRALHAGRWDPRRTAYLHGPVELPTGTDDGAEPRVRIVTEDDSPDLQRLRVESPGGLVVTSALMFPGWSVRVDGAPARPVEVDLALRGVIVPPGTHTVEWRYRPTWIGRACAASGLAAAAAAALVVSTRRRRMRGVALRPPAEVRDSTS